MHFLGEIAISIPNIRPDNHVQWQRERHTAKQIVILQLKGDHECLERYHLLGIEFWWIGFIRSGSPRSACSIWFNPLHLYAYHRT